jgi:hypothetical protein
MTDLLIEAGGDESQVSEEAINSVSDEFLTADFDAAAGRVGAWRTTNCS